MNRMIRREGMIKTVESGLKIQLNQNLNQTQMTDALLKASGACLSEHYFYLWHNASGNWRNAEDHEVHLIGMRKKGKGSW